MVCRTTDVLHTRLLVHLVMVVKGYNLVGIIPSRFERCILIIICCRITGLIVHTHQSMEGQAFQDTAKVDVHTCIKLELTAGPSVLSGCIVVGEDIGQVSLGTTEEVSVNDMSRR